MSVDVQHFAPAITKQLDLETAGAHLVKHGVFTVAEYGSIQKALRNGPFTNEDLASQLLPKINKKPREFYRALREYTSGQDGNDSNKELFRLLPENFVSV